MPDQPDSQEEVSVVLCGFAFYVRGLGTQWECRERATEYLKFMGDEVKVCRRHSKELRDAKYEDRR